MMEFKCNVLHCVGFIHLLADSEVLSGLMENSQAA